MLVKKEKNSYKKPHKIDENSKEFKDSLEVEPSNVIERQISVEEILFKLPIVKNPIVGTPKQIQKTLDSIVKKMQKSPNSKESREQFKRIHLYIHGYLINIVLRQFPYIKGLQTVDIYQETLIALRFKAIPGFKKRKGMSFLNFAKMCIRRHLITLLNASKTIQYNQPMNRAISIDAPVNQGDDDSSNTFANTLEDKNPHSNKIAEKDEAYSVTRDTLMNALSDFEKIVLDEYLTTSTYKEIAKNISKRTNKRCVTKSVDNALLRIRKKAFQLKRYAKGDDMPLFL
jgi:RNA polymerase sporulation-specific sigma factor